MKSALKELGGCRVAVVAEDRPVDGQPRRLLDNALAETFFASLKKELINRSSWPSRAELRTAVFEYIEIFYNATRRHSTLGMRSPNEYEKLGEREQTEQIETNPACPPKRGKTNGETRHAECG